MIAPLIDQCTISFFYFFHLCDQVWLLLLICRYYVYMCDILNTNSTMVHISILDQFRVHYELYRSYLLVKQYVAFVYHFDDHIVVNTVV